MIQAEPSERQCHLVIWESRIVCCMPHAVCPHAVGIEHVSCLADHGWTIEMRHALHVTHVPDPLHVDMTCVHSQTVGAQCTRHMGQV